MPYILAEQQSVDHLRLYNKNKTEYIEVVAEGKVIFNHKINDKAKIPELESILKEKQIEFINTNA